MIIKHNCEELIGKEFDYTYLDEINGEIMTITQKAKVSMIDPDIGLSAQFLDSDEYCICLNGPSSPLNSHLSSEEKISTISNYERLYNFFVQDIIKGAVNVVSLKSFSATIRLSADKCAFNQ